VEDFVKHFMIDIKTIILFSLVFITSINMLFRRTSFFRFFILAGIIVILIVLAWAFNYKNPGGLGGAEIGAALVVIAVISFIVLLIIALSVIINIKYISSITTESGIKSFIESQNRDLILSILSTLIFILYGLFSIIRPDIYNSTIKNRETALVQGFSVEFKKATVYKRGFKSGTLTEDTNLLINNELWTIPKGSILIASHSTPPGSDITIKRIISVNKQSFKMGDFSFDMPQLGNLFLYPDRSIEGADILPCTIEIMGQPARIGSYINFFPDKAIESLYLQDELVLNIEGESITITGRVEFDNEGNIIDTSIKRGSIIKIKQNRIMFEEIKDFVIKPDRVVVKEGVVSEDFKLSLPSGDVVFSKGRIGFYDNGNISYGILKNDTEFPLFNNIPMIIKKNQAVYFDENGMVNQSYKNFSDKTAYFDYQLKEDWEYKILSPLDEDELTVETLDIEYDKDCFEGEESSRECAVTIGNDNLIFKEAMLFKENTSEEEGKAMISFGSLKNDSIINIGDNDLLFKKGDDTDWDQRNRIYFYSTGVVRSGSVKENLQAVVGERSFKFKNLTEMKDFHGALFYRNGSITGGHLAEDTRIILGNQSIIAAAGSGKGSASIGFHPNGEVRYLTLKEPALIRLKKENIGYYIYGKEVYLDKDQEVFFDYQGHLLFVNEYCYTTYKDFKDSFIPIDYKFYLKD
jgi:hypothetical protein